MTNKIFCASNMAFEINDIKKVNKLSIELCISPKTENVEANELF